MAPPVSISAATTICHLLRTNDRAALVAHSTARGLARLDELARARDPSLKIAAQSCRVGGRIGDDRALGYVGDLDDRLVVLAFAVEDGRFLLDDVRTMTASEYEAFGAADTQIIGGVPPLPPGVPLPSPNVLPVPPPANAVVSCPACSALFRALLPADRHVTCPTCGLLFQAPAAKP